MGLIASVWLEERENGGLDHELMMNACSCVGKIGDLERCEANTVMTALFLCCFGELAK